MLAFVCAERMAEAGGSGQTRKAGVASATMLAVIFGLLVALIQGVFSFVRPSRVAETGCSRQGRNARGFASAILAIVVHSLMLVG